jgi:arsenite methyltransferase
MRYEGDIATIQRRLAQTSDLHRRRLAVLDAAGIQPGERVLEAGCGGGALLPILAAAVGEGGCVVGIDISSDQVAAAQSVCRASAPAKAEVQDINQLPYDDASFDAIIAIQVIEYLEQPGRALSELRRVCRANGRLIVFATNWDTVFWNCGAPELTLRVQSAWHKHAPYPNLPAELRPLLVSAGFKMVHQSPVTIINNTFHEDTFSYWASQLILAFATGRNLISAEDADDWITAVKESEAGGTFFFSSTPVLTTAVAVG